mgnify:CR=1 FL=1
MNTNNENEPISWIDVMIEREALPREARAETAEEFFVKWNIPKSTYYWHASKKENQERIVALALNNAKKYAPEVLDGLGQRGIKDNKAAELYLKFILQLAEKTDLTSKGERIIIIPPELINKNDITSSTIPDRERLT